MNPEQTKQIIDGLKVLADKLGTAAANIWAIYIRQAMVNGITNLLLYVAITLIAIFWGKLLKKSYKEEWYGVSDDRDFGIAMGFIISGIAITVGVIIVFCTIPDTITSFVNPQYWALDQLLSTVKK